MDPSVTLFGPVDTYLAPVIGYVLLALILLNVLGRGIEYRRIAKRAEDGVEAVSRNPLRVATNFLLVVGSFYYLTVNRHAGLVVSLFVVAMVVSDIFEFESRKVEARQDWDIERPWGSLAASGFALAYIAYQTLFFLVRPFWSAIV